MEFFLVVALVGLVFSTFAGIVFLVKRSVAPPKTPYDLWFEEAKKQSATKLDRTTTRTVSRMMQ